MHAYDLIKPHFQIELNVIILILYGCFWCWWLPLVGVVVFGSIRRPLNVERFVLAHHIYWFWSGYIFKGKISKVIRKQSNKKKEPTELICCVCIRTYIRSREIVWWSVTRGNGAPRKLVVRRLTVNLLWNAYIRLDVFIQSVVYITSHSVCVICSFVCCVRCVEF